MSTMCSESGQDCRIMDHKSVKLYKPDDPKKQMGFFIRKLNQVFLPCSGNLGVGRVKQKLLSTCYFSKHTCSNLPCVACLEHNLEIFN